LSNCTAARPRCCGQRQPTGTTGSCKRPVLRDSMSTKTTPWPRSTSDLRWRAYSQCRLPVRSGRT
jgi:hypothetical protein